MTSEYIAPLNLKYIFVNLLAGSPEVFTGLLFIAISILAGLFKMPNLIYGMMLVLSAILLYNWVGAGFYIFVVLIVGIGVYWTVSKIVKN